MALKPALTQVSKRGSAMRLIYFELSEMPPKSWADIFRQECRILPHNMWREAWIEGRYVVVDCVPEAIRECHLEDLKTDVATTNKKHLITLIQYDDREATQLKEASEERSGLTI